MTVKFISPTSKHTNWIQSPVIKKINSPLSVVSESKISQQQVPKAIPRRERHFWRETIGFVGWVRDIIYSVTITCQLIGWHIGVNIFAGALAAAVLLRPVRQQFSRFYVYSPNMLPLCTHTHFFYSLKFILSIHINFVYSFFYTKCRCCCRVTCTVCVYMIH